MSGQAEASTQHEAALETVVDAQGEMHLRGENMQIDAGLFKRIMEAALLTAQEPLSLTELKKLSEVPLENRFIEEILEELAQDYAGRGVELNRVASGWRFRARPDLQEHLSRLNPQKQPRYSRAVMETLAIIAYRQPVTRGDIEDIRGVAVASQVLKTLEARGWVESVGTRDVPGKPALYATTRQMLDDLNLRSLQELPSLEEVGNLLDQNARADEVEESAAASDMPLLVQSRSLVAADPRQAPDVQEELDAPAVNIAEVPAGQAEDGQGAA